MSGDEIKSGRRRQRRRNRGPRRCRGEDGQFVERASLGEVRETFAAVDGPVVTTTDVAEVLGLSTESARTKLNELVERGALRRRKTGRTVIYWDPVATRSPSTQGWEHDGHE